MFIKKNVGLFGFQFLLLFKHVQCVSLSAVSIFHTHKSLKGRCLSAELLLLMSW